MRSEPELPRLDPKPSPWPIVLRRCAIVIGSIAFIVSIGILADRVDWPGAYGFTCKGRCLGKHMMESYKLVEGGTLPEVMLFLCLWLWPIVFGILFSPRMWTGPKRDRIRPMQED